MFAFCLALFFADVINQFETLLASSAANTAKNIIIAGMIISWILSIVDGVMDALDSEKS